MELEAVVVLQLGDGAGAGGQRALEEPGEVLSSPGAETSEKLT